MTTEPLDFIPLGLLAVLTTGLLWGALELGYRGGRTRHALYADEKEQPVGAMVASILGLLALVLGFTFGLSASRFDARRQAVLSEANAIGTTFLRARFLPDDQRTEVEGLLRKYVAVRLKAPHKEQLAEAIRQSEEIQQLLWNQAHLAAERDSKSIMTGLFIQSLNELIDLHATRILISLRSRIPAVIWAGLYGLAVLGLAAVGYQAGLTATRRSPAMVGLALAFAVVLMMIADLDRAQEGLLRVGQHALLDVQRSMQPTSP